MEETFDNVRPQVEMKTLVKWTGVSTLIHAGIIAVLCGFSYVSFKQRETAAKAKEAALEAVAKAKEAENAAKAANAPPPLADANAPAPAPGTPPNPATPAAPVTPPIDPAKKPIQAESVLGIDKVAKPNEMPKSPFATKGDDLLKDLK